MSAVLFNSKQELSFSADSTDQLNNFMTATGPSPLYGCDETETETVSGGGGRCDDVCQETLDHKMGGLDIRDTDASEKQAQNGDGSDSGVDIISNTTIANTAMSANAPLQRAVSCNSGGYASSSGGLDETTAATVTTTTTSSTNQGLNISCDSSVVSCSSDFYESKISGGKLATEVESEVQPVAYSAGYVRSTSLNYECCSENGSESSSVTGPSAVVRRSNSVRKKVALFEPSSGGCDTPTTSKVKKSSTEMAVVSSAAGQPQANSQARSRISGIKRTSSLSCPTRTTPAVQMRERPSDRQMPKLSGSKAGSMTSTPTTSAMPATSAVNVRSSSARIAKPQKPDSLPNALNRTQSISMQRLVQRTPSLSRARTPCTPSDDGRWPGNTRAGGTSMMAGKRGFSVTPDLVSVKMRSSMMTSMEVKSSNSNPYSTLPRRRKQKSVEDLTGCADSRSSSMSRDSRMATSVMANSRRNLVNSYGNSMTPTQTKMLPPSTNARNLSARKQMQLQQQQQQLQQNVTSKTRIYHETSVQTALTSGDLEKAFSGGLAVTRPIDAAELHEQQTQTDLRDIEMERLRDEVRQLAQREHELNMKLQREREEKLAMQREIHLNTERVMGMLEMARVAGGCRGTDGEGLTPTSDDGSHDSLLMLESQIQISGHELIERQQEIGQLRQLCRSLQMEMQRSLAVQECLLNEKAAIEQESSEMQDFLQHEKAAMCDALKDLEAEHQTCKEQLANREEEVKVLRDECRHLVRLNEQRRQENRMLQTKYAALETKSKELIVQHNYSVSGASAALSGLHTRLDSLVEQLVSTYNITEHDLEDLAFHTNEYQANNGSGSSCDGTNEKTNSHGLDLCVHQCQQILPQSSDGSLSPQRNQSFIAAVISAIRNATTPAGKKLLARNGTNGNNGHGGGKRFAHSQNNNANGNSSHNPSEMMHNGDDSDSTEMLDSETEPCLMMDNVLEDVTMPDSHSHNMVSSCGGMISQIDIPSELINITTGDESLFNLSQAIANRQQMEMQINALSVQKMSASQLNQRDRSNSEDNSCHDSVAEMPSLTEYCSAQAVVDQVIEVDNLVTKLLKVLRLIQMDNDNCIQQLIVDKNKLQENKEDMLEKLKDLEDVNMKLQDELMDATQELMLKNNDLSNTKAEMQRHRNEIDVRF